MEKVDSYTLQLKQNFISKKIVETVNKFDLDFISVPREKINASAAIFSWGSKNFVLVDEQFSSLERLFLLLHECAHLSEKMTFESPRENSTQCIELRANLWALTHMAGYLSNKFLNHLRHLSETNEALILPALRQKGLDSLHSYWE